MIARLGRLTVAALLGVATVVAVQPGPADAAACAKGVGVSVVVGSDVRCDVDGGGKPARANFTGVGHVLTDVTTEPGFVCQVDGAPASDCGKTPPASAYWSLWWSDGKSGSWAFSGRGVGSLKIPAGGFVAFKFGNGKSAPSVTPIGPAPTPTKKPKPQPKPTKKPAKGSPTSKATPMPSPSTATQKADAKKKAATKKAAKKKAAKAKQSAAPSAAVTTGQPATDDQIDKASAETTGDNGLIWVGGVIAIALLAGMGGMVWRRSSSGGLDS